MVSPPPIRPPASRSTSFSHSQHQPSTPSRLNQSHAPGPSPHDQIHSPPLDGSTDHPVSPLNPFNSDQRANLAESSNGTTPNTSPLRPRHWRNYSTYNCTQSEGNSCEHGHWSPKIRPTTPTSPSSTLEGEPNRSFGGRYARAQSIQGGPNRLLGDAIGDTVFGDGRIFTQPNRDSTDENRKDGSWSRSWSRWWGVEGDDKNKIGQPMSTTRWLASTHGVKNKRRMYVLGQTQILRTNFRDCQLGSSNNVHSRDHWLTMAGIWFTISPSCNGSLSTAGPSSKAILWPP